MSSMGSDKSDNNQIVDMLINGINIAFLDLHDAEDVFNFAECLKHFLQDYSPIAHFDFHFWNAGNEIHYDIKGEEGALYIWISFERIFFKNETDIKMDELCSVEIIKAATSFIVEQIHITQMPFFDEEDTWEESSSEEEDSLEWV